MFKIKNIFLLFSFMPLSVMAYDLKWYNNNTQIAATTCNAGSLIILPTQPRAKNGYKFGGWRIKNTTPTLQCSDLNNLILPNEWRFDGNVATVEKGIISSGVFKASIDIEYVCSSTGGTKGRSGTPSSDSGRYCWCCTGNSQFTVNNTALNCGIVRRCVYDYGYPALGGSSLCKSRCERSCDEDIDDNANDMNRALFYFN